MFVITRDENDGISFETNKYKYDLLELKSYRGTSTSDIVAIMVADKEKGYIGMLDYSYGATDLTESLIWAEDTIRDFEAGRKEPMETMLEK